MERLNWKIKTFNELSALDFHQILKTRIDVFVVEQNCPYPELDGDDLQAIHIWAVDNGNVVAYCRVFGPGIKYTETSIGRVLTHQNYRKMNLGKTLMKFAITTIETKFPGNSIRISAQDYLIAFYTNLGFCTTGKNYLEDGIPHSEMLKS